MTTFADIGVSADLSDALADQGITEPFAIQEMTVRDGLAGRDVCGKAQTGSGKTLAFGLPLVSRTDRADDGKPTALILVPTRELANQVAEVVAPLGEVRDLRSIAVYGGTNLDRQIEEIKAGIDIIIATPGRLIDLIDRGAMDVAGIQRVVIDEADRMADMGFLPQVEWVLRHIETEHQTMLFSATLDGAVDHVIKRHLSDPVLHEVVTEQVTVDQMQHRFFKVHEMDRVRVVAAIVNNHSKTIIFTNTKRAADRLVRDLNREGVRVQAIHGDLRQQAREKALEQFSVGKLPALVATDVAARGIHVDDIGVVVHFDPPDDHKTYLHRSGRTARAGSTGVAVSLALWDQEIKIKQLQRRLDLNSPLVEVFSNNPRLADLVDGWDDDADAKQATGS
ncbi:MAG: DEAD/DEAH box helicase [Actinomycetota bacterium]